MTLFRRLYGKVIKWSEHHHAPYYLAGVSFIESSVFPIPPDVMLIPMVLSKPLKAWNYAGLTTLASVLGGLFGYLLGFFAFDLIGNLLIQTYGYEEFYHQVVAWFAHYGFLAILVAGFTPIPYKLFTIAAGATQMSLLPFIAASIVGRGLRFFLVAACIRAFGKKIEPLIVKYIDIMGWLMIILIAALILALKS